jgi:adenine-specific DNA-methyltransferase
MQKLDGKTFNVVQDNIEKLKQLFPEVFTENKIDFEKLMLTLGEHVEKEKERYEFTWNGKTKAIQLAQKQTTGTLRPCKEESVNWDTTKNLYIEGDNLEVLRILQNSYRNKVKMIYIDPPYNTGKDFVYKDDFYDNVKSYLEKNDENMKSNPETNGRFHTDWLNMMYPRLKVARNLLKEDGVIFISIDDHEVHNLRKLCDEIFGDNNFIAEIVWQKVHTRKNSARYFSDSHEYILCYAKKKIIDRNDFGWKRNLLPREDTSAYKNPDNDPKGPWKLDPITAHNPYSADYKIVKPNGVVLSRPQNRYWALSEENWKKKVENNEVVWGEGDSYPMIKRYLSEVQDGLVPVTLFDRDFAGDTVLANKELKSIFNLGAIFDYTKPTKLIKRLLQVGTDSDDIILDFFSGSGTTAHAIMELNKEDNGSRRFIMIQIPEQTDEKSEAFKAGYKNICEIGKERIRRAGQKILEENKDKEGIEKLDIGFKVFKLDDTNLKVWDEESADLERDLLDLIDPVKEGRTQEDVVYEILLKYGVDLTVPIEETKIADKVVYSVGMGYLLICLERDLTLEHIEEIAKQKPARVVFYDEGFKDDTVRINAQQILKRYGVEDIRVI